jgi:UrcA family protein
MYSHKKKAETACKRATLFILGACLTGMAVGGFPHIFAKTAHASTRQDVQKRIVRYGDLNLASEQGRAALDQRIRRAAKQVCIIVGTPAILQRRKMRTCAETARSKAWAGVEERMRNIRLARDQ